MAGRIERGEEVETLLHTRENRMVSEHGVALEVWGEAEPAVEVLGIVDEVLTNDLGVGVG